MRMKLPIAARIPVVVMAFMLAVSAFASQRVLSRLDETQSQQVRDLANVYLEGLSIALVDPIVRDDVWQVFDILDRSQRQPAGISPIEKVVTTPDGVVIASSRHMDVPSRSPLPETYKSALPDGETLGWALQSARAFVNRRVEFEGRPVGNIYATIDIAPLLAERREVLWTLVLSNAILTLSFALLAGFIVQRMMRPMQRLARVLELGADGEFAAIPQQVLAKARPEYARVFAAYNTLVRAMDERETLTKRLAEEERLASLGRLASGMAHEINNPLGGLFSSIDTLKRHGDSASVRSKSIDIIDRGLKSIRDVVRSTLMTYRSDDDQRNLTAEDIDDLRLLIGSQAHRKGLVIGWDNRIAGECAVPATAVRQIALNLVLNACQASPAHGTINVVVSSDSCDLTFSIDDQGPGLPVVARDNLMARTPAATPISSHGGLGLWMTRRLVDELGGRILVETQGRQGTRIEIVIPFAPALEVRDVA
jgi:signal transduction histidine kinase